MPRSKINWDQQSLVSAHQVIGPAQGRLTLIIIPPSVGHVTLSNSPVTADGQGLVLAAGQATLYLDVDDAGNVVQEPWYGLYSAGATPLSWIEVFA